MSMSDIRIRRFDDHPHNWQGAIEPSDRRWSLCIDEEGVPHLFLRVYAMVDGERVTGLVDFEQFTETQIRDVLDGDADDDLVSPEEAEAALAELQAAGYRCPA